MSLVLGVDAGGSKTYALVAESAGTLLGFGQAGPGNHQVVGPDVALAEIELACLTALRRAELSVPLDFGFFGLAGADLPVDYDFLTPAIESLGLATSIQIKNDTLVSLRAGLKKSWGVGIICGAGMNAGGIGRDGETIQLPGLGPLSGDWGGGGDLAQEMIRAISRAWDGRGQPTILSDMVLAALDMISVEQMISRIYEGQFEYYPGQFDERRLLHLVPLLFEAALQGDAVAERLVVRLGTEVGTTANAIIRRLDLAESDVEVVLGGSVFKGRGPLLMDTISSVIRDFAPRAIIERPEFEPVVGAVFLALEGLGIGVDETVRDIVRASLPPELAGVGETGEGGS